MKTNSFQRDCLNDMAHMTAQSPLSVLAALATWIVAGTAAVYFGLWKAFLTVFFGLAVIGTCGMFLVWKYAERKDYLARKERAEAQAAAKAKAIN